MSNQIGSSNNPLAPVDPLANVLSSTGFGEDAATTTGQFQGRMVSVSPNSLSVTEEMSEDADMDGDVENEDEQEEAHKLSDRHGPGEEDPEVGDDDDHVENGQTAVGKGDSKSTMTDEKFLAFLSKLREREPKSQSDVLDEVKKHFTDVTDQHQALEKAEKLLAEMPEEKDMSDNVTKAREELYQQQGPAIRAGLNVATDAEEFARLGLASIDELREFYRKSVLNFENVADLFSKIVKFYGKDKFSEALTFLIRAGGNDMASQGPSVSVAHLKSVTDQLYDVEVLGNLHRNLGELMERVKKLFKEGNEKASFEVMSKILDLTQARWIATESISTVSTTAQIGGVESLIYFLTSLKEIIRLIPLKIYPNNENRGKLIDATQEALDHAIERDE